MTGLELLRQKWTMMNTEKLFVEKEIANLREKIEYYQGKADSVQGEMDDLMKEIKKLKE